MADGKVYLKPNVAAEPLCNRGYAWSSLVAPATAAMFESLLRLRHKIGTVVVRLYGPLLTKPIGRKHDQSKWLDGSNYERGVEIVNLLNPRQVYVYAMGQEPWLTFLTSIQYTEESRPIIESGRLVEECRGRGKEPERLYGRKEILL